MCSSVKGSSRQAYTSTSLHAGANDTEFVQAVAGADARCWLGLVVLRFFWGAALLNYGAQAASCAAGLETSASSRSRLIP